MNDYVKQKQNGTRIKYTISSTWVGISLSYLTSILDVEGGPISIVYISYSRRAFPQPFQPLLIQPIILQLSKNTLTTSTSPLS